MQDAGLDGWAREENGNCVRLGRARQLFLSAEPNSNIVGHTADLLLEIDEAQDVDVDKFDKELRPMAASTGATTVFYGTAWDDANLLERAKQTHLERSAATASGATSSTTGRSSRRATRPTGASSRGERERLGAEHPMFLTPVLPADAARRRPPLRPDAARRCCAAATRGSTRRWRGETYVAGLDVAGEALGAGGEAGHDATVLTIGRVVPAADEPLRGSRSRGRAPLRLDGRARTPSCYGALVSLLRETWRVAAPGRRRDRHRRAGGRLPEAGAGPCACRGGEAQRRDEVAAWATSCSRR